MIRRWLYRVYLRLPWWWLVRRLALHHYGYRCAVCGTHRGLQVHHLRYWREGQSVLWREHMADLRVLCRTHHKAAHGLR